MARHFVGLGLGPIQIGLFLLEARRAGCFSQLTVADVDADLVRAVRAGGGCLTVNEAGVGGITQRTIDGVRILNPRIPEDRAELVRAIADADELATALPSVDFFERGGEASPASCLADGFRLRAPGARPAVVYAAENHNHAAEILERCVTVRLTGGRMDPGVQFVNTVIGKMSGVITDEAEVRRLGLVLAAPGLSRAVLVEEFNRILITRIRLAGFVRGLAAFVEKDDLLPFEEAKLYGHNAVHALLGFLAHQRGLGNMAEAGRDSAIMGKAREAFLQESGAGLLNRHAGKDALFTPGGFRAYADDLLVRMVNPFLSDPVARVIRDPRRKLGWDDRLVGAMRHALQAGVSPVRFAEGAGLAARGLPREQLRGLWPATVWDGGEAPVLVRLMGFSPDDFATV